MENKYSKKINVLDHGFVEYIDHMGSDEAIVEAARTSYGKGTTKVSDDETLIRYLMRKKHTSPFEFCEVKFCIKAPMDEWRQHIRHRVANVCEYSTRYSEAIDDTYCVDAWRMQSKSNKQGSSTENLDSELQSKFSAQEKDLHNISRSIYNDRINNGVAREVARKDLPLSTYTRAYWKMDLHNLFHFLKLRLDEHAQYEIRMYAEAIGQIVKDLFPIAWSAFEDYRLNSIELSARDLLVLKELLNNSDRNLSMYRDILPEGWCNNRCRERDEFLEKLKIMGLSHYYFEP